MTQGLPAKKTKNPEEQYKLTLEYLGRAVGMIGEDLRAIRTLQRERRGKESHLDKELTKKVTEYGKALGTILQSQTRAMAYMKLIKASDANIPDDEISKMLNEIKMNTFHYVDTKAGIDGDQLKREVFEEVTKVEDDPEDLN